jgi:hypothetical protein
MRVSTDTNYQPPTAALKEKAADMISRLRSIVESFSAPRAAPSEVFADDL